MVNIRYTKIESTRVINLCGPEHDPFGWDLETIEERRKRTEHRVRVTNNRNGFFDKLEESILNTGIQNPLIFTTGLYTDEYKKVATPPMHWFEKVPPERRYNLAGLITCERIGGSRLYIAQKHELWIPCLINDFTNQFPNEQLITSEEEALSLFSKPPDNLYINNSGIWIGNMDHFHLR